MTYATIRLERLNKIKRGRYSIDNDLNPKY